MAVSGPTYGRPRRSRVRLLVLGGLTAALVSALLGAGARSATDASARIAFTRADGVYLMRPDGTGVRRVAHGGAAMLYGGVAWSPDGRTLAYARSDGIWVVSATGGASVRIVAADGLQAFGSPTWSPSGRMIAFSAHQAGDRDIWIVNADGSKLRRVRRTPRLFEGKVSWSPQGGRLVFDSGGWVSRVYVMQTDGSGLRDLTPGRTWAGSGQPSWSPDGRRIVFARSSGIWVMDAHGQGQARLTSGKPADAQPAWSADGRRIAFVRGKTWSRRSEIYVVNADGTAVKRLTYNRVPDSSPAWRWIGAAGARSAPTRSGTIAYLSAAADPSVANVIGRTGWLWVAQPDGRRRRLSARRTPQDLSWSPDGRRIAVVEGSLGDGGGLSVLDADGRLVKRLTVSAAWTSEGPHSLEDSVSWSPDGRTIAIFRIWSRCTGCTTFRDVLLISPEGGAPRRLTWTPDVIERDLAWSPNGRRIAFTTDGWWGAVYVMNDDGTHRRQLTVPRRDGYCAGPAWSPDSRRIAVYCDNHTNSTDWEISVVGVSGGGLTQLTDTTASNRSPAWSPDGRTIAFTSDRDGHFQLYLMNADGSGQRRLVRSRTDDFHPVWQPAAMARRN